MHRRAQRVSRAAPAPSIAYEEHMSSGELPTAKRSARRALSLKLCVLRPVRLRAASVYYLDHAQSHFYPTTRAYRCFTKLDARNATQPAWVGNRGCLRRARAYIVEWSDSGVRVACGRCKFTGNSKFLEAAYVQ